MTWYRITGQEGTQWAGAKRVDPKCIEYSEKGAKYYYSDRALTCGKGGWVYVCVCVVSVCVYAVRMQVCEFVSGRRGDALLICLRNGMRVACR